MRLVLLSALVVLGTSCPDANYTRSTDGSCYRVYEQVEKRSDSIELCGEDGAYLLAVHSQTVNSEIADLATNATFLPWLGISCDANSSCVWDDGSTVDYRNFADGNPNVDSGNCVFMALSGVERGKWKSADCEYATFLPICQLSEDSSASTCPSDFTESANDGRTKCYKYVPSPEQRDDATSACASANAHLASLHSSQENVDLLEFLQTSSPGEAIFLGLKENNATYEWSDQSPYDFHDWAYPFPSDRYGECVALMTAGGNKGKWRNVACTAKLPFVCEAKPSDNAVPTPGPTTSPEGKCPTLNFFSDNGTITSPGFGGNYGALGLCDYNINVAIGSVVKIRFLSFDLDDGDFVELFDGDFSSSPLVAKLNSSVDPDEWFVTTTNLLLLRFVVSSNGGNATGWKAQFITDSNVEQTTSIAPTVAPIQGSCGGEFNISGVIASPNYPKLYPTEQFCIYTLRALARHHVRIIFAEVNVDSNHDEVLVFDGPSIKSPKLSGGKNPLGGFIATSTDEWLTVLFISDSTEDGGKGFWAQFLSV